MAGAAAEAWGEDATDAVGAGAADSDVAAAELVAADVAGGLGFGFGLGALELDALAAEAEEDAGGT